MARTVCACASAVGGAAALLRLSGPRARAVAAAAHLRLPASWRADVQDWPLRGGTCPVVVAYMAAGRSYTGEDLVEVMLPGAPDLVDCALAALGAAGAEPAAPGEFTRQALASGRIGLIEAEAVLALTSAGDAAAAERALARLQGELGAGIAQAREQLLALRAEVEAGLDFVDEAGVADDAAAGDAIRAGLGALRTRLARWRIAAGQTEGLPLVVIAGPANAGKSSLFAALSGATALISAIPGTTRDSLEEAVTIGGRRLRLVDTAGWMAASEAIDRDAQAATARLVAAADLILACSAPDAPLAAGGGPLPALPAMRILEVATKADLGARARAGAVAVSVVSGTGLAQLRAAMLQRLGSAAVGEPRQQRLLADADRLLERLAMALPADELLAEDLRRLDALLAELVGAASSEELLGRIFSRFCIGK